MRRRRHRLELIFALLAPFARAQAQSPPELQQILDRLNRLESENRELREQVRELREQMRSAGAPPAVEKLEERTEIQDRRTDELAQVKVEASQRFPIRLTGMALVNAFYNSKLNGGADNPAIASQTPGGASGGATWRQTILGLDYRGPQTLWNAKIHGSIFMDFFGGANTPTNNLMRLRTADFTLDWQTRSLTVAQDKPILATREPASLSQVGIAPLTGAGNLWLWEPQIRFEQRLRMGERAGLNARIGVVQTSETSAAVPAAFASTLERYRPGLEGRFELFGQLGDTRRIEIAPGFHFSSTHVAGGSAPSRVFSMDWLIQPVRPLELTGFFYSGENIALFGTGGIRQGFSIIGPRNILSVRSRGGWAQLKLTATNRLSFHLLAGQQDDSDSDARAGLGAGGSGGGIGKNQAYGANFFYKLAPNVIMSFETLQTRTRYLLPGKRLINHYDLAFAYLF
jgi:uncharacterized protein (UPF0335 family)